MTEREVLVRPLCFWNSPEGLCREIAPMCEDPASRRYKGMRFVGEDETPDLFLILNFPRGCDTYVASRSIVFQMEPWVYDPRRPWGVHTWEPPWAEPDEKDFLFVHRHRKMLNPCKWEMDATLAGLATPNTMPKTRNRIASVVSEKIHDEGHALRVELLRYLDDRTDLLDVYGRANHFNLKSYRGTIRDKMDVFSEYKYYLMAENNTEHNYVTEKLYECVLTETLCFYWGCPNLSDYFDPRICVWLDMADTEVSATTIRRCLRDNEWERRLPVLRKEKERVLREYTLPAMLYSVLFRSLEWRRSRRDTRCLRFRQVFGMLPCLYDRRPGSRPDRVLFLSLHVPSPDDEEGAVAFLGRVRRTIDEGYPRDVSGRSCPGRPQVVVLCTGSALRARYQDREWSVAFYSRSDIGEEEARRLCGLFSLESEDTEEDVPILFHRWTPGVTVTANDAFISTCVSST